MYKNPVNAGIIFIRSGAGFQYHLLFFLEVFITDSLEKKTVVMFDGF